MFSHSGFLTKKQKTSNRFDFDLNRKIFRLQILEKAYPAGEEIFF